MEKPDYAPNVVNQTVSWKGNTWKGNPGSDWVLEGSGGDGGGSYDALLGSLPKAQDFAASLDIPQDNAFGDYMKYLSSQESPVDFYRRMGDEAGLPEMRKTQSTLQGQIYSLEDSLRRVEPDVSATSRNSVMTEAQRRGQVQERQKPMVESLGWLGQSVGRISSAIAEKDALIMNLTGLNEQQVSRMSDAFKTNIQIKSDQAARKMTGFTTDLQNTLQVNLAKIARKEAIDDREWQKTWDLFKMEEGYKQAAKAEASKLISVSEGNSLYDPSTGKVAFTAPKTYKPESGGGTGGGANQYYGGAPKGYAKVGTIVGNYYSTGNSWIPIVP